MRFVKFNGRVLLLFISVFLFSELIIAQKPGWVLPNPALFSFNTSVTAVIRFDGQISASLEDTIAFFVGSQIRGISIPTKIGNDIRHYGTVYSSLTAEPISIKIYHALSNKVYEVKDSLPFVAQAPIGDYENPYEVTLFSSGDAPISIDSIEEKFTLENIPFDTIDLQLILNQPDDDSVSWSVRPHPDFLTVITGNKLVISPRAGFIGSGVIEIKAVEQTINANNAIQQIKLNVLKVPVRPAWDSIPGQGITKGNVFKTFSLPDFENKYQGDCLSFEYTPILPKTNQPDTMPVWNVQQTFLNSMTFIAKSIYTPILPFNHPDDRLAAFIDGELRGVAEPQVINGQVLYFLGIGSQQSVGTISFHFYSGALKILFISPLKIPYISSAVRGSVENPFEINLSPLQPVIDSNNLVQLQIVDTSWVGKMDFQFIARDCSMPKLGSASRPFLESVTFTSFWVTSNNTDLFTYYRDFDGDGFGDASFSQTIASGNAPVNYVTNKLDCDDRDDAIKPYPTVSKIQDFTLCNGILSDTITLKRGTNGLNSLSSKTIYKWINNNSSIGLGASGSGTIAPFLTANAKNVTDSAQIIVTPEINGCIGVSDTFLLFVKAEKLVTYYKDLDGDGFGNATDSLKICEANIPPNYVTNKLDCDDRDDAIKPYPTVSKIQDFTLCNGILSDTITLKRGTTGINSMSSNTIYKWTNNNTSIGLGASGSGTIAPFLSTNTRIFTDSAQIVVTPELNGCIGVSDTFLLYVKAEKLVTYYKDTDGDGFGDATDSLTICEANIPQNYVTNKLDCDDSDDAIKPYPTLEKIQDFTYCTGIKTDTIFLKQANGGINSKAGNIMFKWTNNNSAIGLVASGSGNIVPFFSSNTKNIRDSARIIVTPEINGCPGINDTFLLIVKPDTIPRVGSLNCSAYTSSSLALPNANDLYQNTLRMPYTGGNGLKFDSMTIKSEGVTGLTMKLKQGILIKGDGFLEFDISGIPLQEGTAKFSIDFGRAGCDLRQPCEITFNVSLEKPEVDSILCSKSFYLPNKIYSKVPYRGKLDLPYMGGNQKLETSQVFTSEGIRGLNAKFNSDTLKRNGGILSFNLDGLPEQLGTSSILINIGGKSCVINLLVENLPVTLPKFFSPNGDGKNERWEIPYFNILYPQGTVIILDRNGRKLLEYNNGNFDGWDGNINGYSASTGVYWYVVQLDKGSIPLKGNFTLIR
jgi:gliding motility-associated-like protein